MTDTTIIATLRKNAREDLRVSLDKFNGHDLLSLRVWFGTDDGASSVRARRVSPSGWRCCPS